MRFYLQVGLGEIRDDLRFVFLESHGLQKRGYFCLLLLELLVLLFYRHLQLLGALLL